MWMFWLAVVRNRWRDFDCEANTMQPNENNNASAVNPPALPSHIAQAVDYWHQFTSFSHVLPNNSAHRRDGYIPDNSLHDKAEWLAVMPPHG